MWRIYIPLFILLTSIITALLVWQWNTYSDINGLSENQIELVEQEVTVRSSSENHLTITQVFKGLLPEKEYMIVVPEKVKDWSCQKEDGQACESLDENPSSFLAENHKINIVYHIPVKAGNAPFLLNDWLGTISSSEITKTKIEIIDSTRKTGTWVVGIPIKGTKELELIDYYVFEGNVAQPSLYYQPSPLHFKKGDHSLEFYTSEGSSNLSFSFASLEQMTSFSGTSVVFTNEFSETNGTGLMILKPNIEEELLERKIVYNFFLEKGNHLPLEERWLIDVLTSLLTNQASNIEKGNQFIDELQQNLTEEELIQFLNLVIKLEEISPELLDDLMEEVAGKSTEFFSLNKNEETPLIPLYFYDTRKVKIEGETHNDLEVLIIEGERLFPFVSTMSGLGFEIKVLAEEETILLSKGNNSYRFYMMQNIFIYNEEDYGLLENPLRTLNGKLYMEASWLQTLFEVTITNDEEYIVLSLGY